MEEKKKLQRLSIDLPIDLHSEIKSKASKRYITMRIWVLRAILRQLEYERKGDK